MENERPITSIDIDSPVITMNDVTLEDVGKMLNKPSFTNLSSQNPNSKNESSCVLWIQEPF